MNEPRHLTGDEVAQWKRVYERSGDRVSMHREFALALIATAEQLHTDADTLHQALAILADLIDDEPCSFDHHGYCQTHCWLQEGECPVKRGRDLLAAVPDTGAEP